MSQTDRAKFATSFAPYTPPPDDPTYAAAATINTSRPSTQRAWFPSQHVISYQSGGVPTFNTSQAGGAEVAEAGDASVWETRYGLRVDMLAAFAYLFGPISALLLLILETHNDYVRFHAYQSALSSMPLLVIRILLSLLRSPGFIQTIFTVLLVASLAYLAWQAYAGAALHGLTRFQLPGIGPLAERWVTEE